MPITIKDIIGDFNSTMSGLEKGLQVRHITTPTAQLLCCKYDEDIKSVLAHPDLKLFDQIPVKKNETIIGLLRRPAYPGDVKGLVKDHMLPLGENILVSADTPLLEFIQNDSLDRIVINSTNIYGLVTKSDILKLPVSLLGFALVTHVETLMLTMIRDTGIKEEIWMPMSANGKGGKIEKAFKQLMKNRSDTYKLDVTQFFDKIEILEKLVSLEEYSSQLPDKSFIDELQEIRKLRNTVAHTGNPNDGDDVLQTFILRLRKTREWIEKIERWRNER